MTVVTVTATACTGERAPTTEVTPVDAPDVIRVTSSAFDDGAPIPARFTCDGGGDVPPLAWEGVPRGTSAVALVVDDPDAPRGTFVHWVVLDLPARMAELSAAHLPPGAVQAKNSAGHASWFPPCPPSGTHRYRFTVYALADKSGLRDGVALDKALHAVASGATARGRLVGTYSRGG